jgi:hypothetical protein
MSDTSSVISDIKLLEPCWPDLFSPNRQLPAIPTPLYQTPITQYHISNQMFPLPYVSSYGSKADTLVTNVGDKQENNDAETRDMDIVEELFDLGKYTSPPTPADGIQESSLHPHDSASNQFARASPSLSIVSNASDVKGTGAGTRAEPRLLEPQSKPMEKVFEQLKKSEEYVREGYSAQQKTRTKRWLDGIFF